MLPNKYTPEDLTKDFGKRVEEFTKIRGKAKFDLVSSATGLMEMGVKLINGSEMIHMPGLDVREYERCNFQEFAWEALYEDGMVGQFINGQHHFGNIDQSRLSKFRWISNFDCDTDNAEKRAIIELDFKTGLFRFINGYVPQETRTFALMGYEEGKNPKLIMKMVKRESNTVNMGDGSVGEVLRYNRYLIGWETDLAKLILCVEPNGFVHPWHG